jgi:thymidylate synthase
MNNNLDKQYLNFVQDILANGTVSGDRTGTGTKKVFGRMLHHNMNEGYPLLTSKKVHFKGILTELLWFLSGVTNIKPLVDQNNYIWVGDCYKRYCQYIQASTRSEDETYMVLDNDHQTHRIMTREEFIDMIKSAPTNYNDYTDKDMYSSMEAWKSDFVLMFGELGPVYGAMWTNWKGINQIENAIETLKTNPNSRRILVTAWDPSYVDKVVLPPCHFCFQFTTEELSQEERIKIYEQNGFNTDRLRDDAGYIAGDALDNQLNKADIPKHKLNLLFNMRSIDLALGLPFNIASYGLLLMMFAQQTNMIPNTLVASLGDLHIYLNQQEGMEKQLTQETFDLPQIKIKKASSIFDYKVEDFELVNYKSAEKIAMPLSN